MDSVINKSAPASPRSLFLSARPSHGFTLIEIILTIAILVLIIGALIPMTGSFFKSESLRETAMEVAYFVRGARTAAVTSGLPAILVVNQNSLILFPPRVDLAEEQFAELASPPEPKVLQLPKDTRLELMTWPDTHWQKPEEAVWTFQASGLLTPNRVKVISGDYHIEFEFHPLTAEIREEFYELP